MFWRRSFRKDGKNAAQLANLQKTGMGVGFILVAIVFGTTDLLRPSVKSPEDLVTLRGRIEGYSFVDGSPGIRHSATHHYLIHLDNYAATFQIPADFVDVFSKDQFEADLKKGDTVSLAIPKQSLPQAATSAATVWVFGVHANFGTFLDEQDALPLYNSPLQLIINGIMLLTGAAFLVWRFWPATA